jgi:hypothetical protein
MHIVFSYIDTNSAVSGKYNVYVYDTYKLGIGEAYRASSQFCTTSAQTLFFKTLYQYCVYPAEKKNPWVVIF